MRKETMQFLSAALDHSDIEHTTTDTYSGRAMYGRTTFAVVLADLLVLVGAVACFIHEVGAEPPADLMDCQGLRQDSMGKNDTIIY